MVKNIVKTFSFFFLALLIVLASSGVNSIPLRVALFSGIPDPDENKNVPLCKKIQEEFSELHKDINLEINLPPVDDLYDSGALSNLLKEHHIVEIDSVMMNELYASKQIKPWNSEVFPLDPFHRATTFSCKHPESGELFGVPHWLCSNFHAVDETCTSKIPIAIDLAGSWNLSTLYYESYAALTHKPKLGYEKSVVATWEKWNKESTDLHSPIPEIAIENLAALALDAHPDGINGSPSTNPALNGEFHNLPWATAIQYGEIKTRAFCGYGESLSLLHDIAPLRLERTKVTSMLYSQTRSERGAPLVYIDQFVLSSQTSEDDQIKAAEKFISYMNNPNTLRWIALGEDTTKKTPRYLMPALLASFEMLAEDNPHYKDFYSSVIRKEAIPFPPTSKNEVKVLSGLLTQRLMNFS